MNPIVQFKLITELSLERFKNLSAAVRPHTIIIWDGDEASFWCEKHNTYFEENESCPQCVSEEPSVDQLEPEFTSSHRKPTEHSSKPTQKHLFYREILSVFRRKA